MELGKQKWTEPTRLKVALGAAKGLAYLHSSSSVGIPIVHRDFKSINVLLNANFGAKVAVVMEKKREANKRGKACWGRERKRVVRLLR
ncbi:hypothetical protein ACB098_03G152900 [Castanea mollissima]